MSEPNEERLEQQLVERLNEPGESRDLDDFATELALVTGDSTVRVAGADAPSQEGTAAATSSARTAGDPGTEHPSDSSFALVLWDHGCVVAYYADTPAGRAAVEADLATLRAEYADAYPGVPRDRARFEVRTVDLLTTPRLTRRAYCPRCHHLLDEHGVRAWLWPEAAPMQCGRTDGQANLCWCQGPEATDE